MDKLRRYAPIPAAVLASVLLHLAWPTPAPVVIDTHPGAGVAAPTQELAGHKLASTLPGTTYPPTHMYGADLVRAPLSSCPGGVGSTCLISDKDDSGAIKLRANGSTYGLHPLWSAAQGATSMEVGPQSDGTLLKFDPGDGYPLWRLVTGTSASGDAQPDAVMRLCWNCNKGAGRVDPAYQALGIYMERHYLGGHPQSEFHLASKGLNDVETRFLSFEGHEDDNSTALYENASVVSICAGVDASSTGVACINQLQDATKIYSGMMSHGNGAAGPYMLVDNTGAYLYGKSDNTGGSVIASPNGQLTLTTNYVGRLQTQGVGVNLEWASGYVKVGGTILYPETDGTTQLGGQSNRWTAAWVAGPYGGSDVAADKPACSTGPTQGQWFITRAVHGVSDGVEQICHCTSNDVCSWVTK